MRGPRGPTGGKGGARANLPPEDELGRGVVGDESVAAMGIVELERRSPAVKVLLQFHHPRRDGREALLADRHRSRATGGAAREGHCGRRGRSRDRADVVAARGTVVDALRSGRVRSMSFCEILRFATLWS